MSSERPSFSRPGSLFVNGFRGLSEICQQFAIAWLRRRRDRLALDSTTHDLPGAFHLKRQIRRDGSVPVLRPEPSRTLPGPDVSALRVDHHLRIVDRTRTCRRRAHSRIRSPRWPGAEPDDAPPAETPHRLSPDVHPSHRQPPARQGSRASGFRAPKASPARMWSN